MSDLFQKQMRSSTIIATAMSGEEEKYAPLPLGKVKVGQTVPFELFLKMKDKKSADPKIVRCCTPGDTFQKDWFEKLKKLQIQWVYYSLNDLDQLFAYLQKNLDDHLKFGDLSEEEKADQVYDLTQVWIMRFFTAEKSRTGEQISLALSLVDDLMETVKYSSYNSLLLLEIKKQNFYVYTHSVNCCLLGLAFANYLGWKADKARSFGLGAMIHDLGYSRLPRKLLEKKEGPTEDDLPKIQRHPIEGFRMLQSFAHLPWEALQMVLQHHENGDGSGYPEGLKLVAIHSWARIMRIIDTYEELTTERPWHPPLPPREALWTMRQQWEERKIYDHQYLLAFINFLAGRARRTARRG